jgi:hypothetical protein
MAGHLYGVHDYAQEWAALFKSAGKTGWSVETVEVGDNPNDMSGADFRHIEAQGLTVICRINYSHHGQGTIPLLSRYNEFAARVRNFVAATKGCHFFIIGNEPNLAGERPSGVPITPKNYVRCYQLCKAAIRQVDRTATILVAAVAPYNVDTGWCMDYWEDMLAEIYLTGGADGFALHCYSRGNSPQSVVSEDKMDSPYNAYYNGFRAYRDFLRPIPKAMRHLPVLITETDQIEPWLDANNGWVRAAYKEIDDWNKVADNQKIQALVLYRWPKYDQWWIVGKNGVVNDLYQALRETNYLAPAPNTVTQPLPAPVAGPSATPKFTDGANVRSAPSVSASKVGAFAYGTFVPVTGKNQTGDWWQVQLETGKGWVFGEVVLVKDGDKVGVVPTSSPPLVTPPSTTVDKSWMIQAWCRTLGIDPKLAQAILTIESAGRSFENGRAVIRFENHIFVDRLKKHAPQLEGKAREHFVFGTPSHTGHKWRPTLSTPWDTQHDGGQNEEWQTYEFAKSIHPQAATEAISMGMGQVMGFNHGTLGYSSAQQMLDDFNNKNLGELNQLTGFFAYIVNRQGLLDAVKRKDWNTIAVSYNGLGGAATYAPLIRNKYLELGGKE